MNETRSQTLLLALGMLCTLGFVLGPFAYMLLVSLCQSEALLRPEPTLHFTLAHYRTVLTTESLHFLAYVRNSLIVSALSALLSVWVAALAAYAITRLPLPGTTLVLLGTLAVSLFPPVSLVSYLFTWMAAAGWINTYQALIFPYVAWTLPLSLWVLVSYFAQVPRELDRAALLDGCSRWQVLRHIVLPVAMPGLVSTALLAFIFAFNELLFALMLSTDYHASTIPVALARFEGQHGQLPWGEIMAAAVLTTVPVVVLVLRFQGRIIQGLTRGAVKA